MTRKTDCNSGNVNDGDYDNDVDDVLVMSMIAVTMVAVCRESEGSRERLACLAGQAPLVRGDLLDLWAKLACL